MTAINPSAMLAIFYGGLYGRDHEQSLLLRNIATRLIEVNLSSSQEHRCSLRLTNWLIRRWLPVWLEQVPALSPHAEHIRILPAEGTEAMTFPVIRAAEKAAKDAATEAAKGSVSDTATGAAWAAAWDAASWAATPAVTVVDVWSATRATAWIIAWSAAREAVLKRSLTGSVTRDVAWTTACTAALGALRTVLESLQEEATLLLMDLCDLSPLGKSLESNA